MPGTMDTGYLHTQVTTIIGQLHTIWDEIGIPRNDRESREAEVCAATPIIDVADLRAALRSSVGDTTQPIATWKLGED